MSPTGYFTLALTAGGQAGVVGGVNGSAGHI